MSEIENKENGGPKDNQDAIFPVFVNEQTARVPVHGSVPRPLQKQAPNCESKLPEILDKLLKDPNFSVAEVNRLIAVEMALIVQDMRTCESDGAAAFKRKNYMGQIGALRALAEAAKEADAWAKRADVLNFDGPKFKFAFDKIVDYFKEAALKALKGDESTVNSILSHWRDIMAVHDQELRRETEKFSSGTDAPSAHLPSQELNEPREFFKGKNLQCPETPPTGQSASKPTTENGATDNPTADHSERSDHHEPENGTEPPEDSVESEPDEDGAPDDETTDYSEHSDDEPESGTEPSEDLVESEADEDGAEDNATADYTERGVHDEPANGTEPPYRDLADSDADLPMMRNVWESSKREQESDYDVEPPPDSGIKPKDGNPPGPSGDDIEPPSDSGIKPKDATPPGPSEDDI
jgi:hypothetical protein